MLYHLTDCKPLGGIKLKHPTSPSPQTSAGQSSLQFYLHSSPGWCTLPGTLINDSKGQERIKTLLESFDCILLLVYFRYQSMLSDSYCKNVQYLEFPETVGDSLKKHGSLGPRGEQVVRRLTLSLSDAPHLKTNTTPSHTSRGLSLSLNWFILIWNSHKRPKQRVYLKTIFLILTFRNKYKRQMKSCTTENMQKCSEVEEWRCWLIQ